MEYSEFLKIINILKKASDQIDVLEDNGINIYDFVEPFHTIVDILIKTIYGEDGVDWFGWFCYENDFGEGTLTATDNDNNPIAYSIESLWALLEAEYKIK